MNAVGPRDVAVRVLTRIQDGAYASATLDGEVRRAGLDRRDAALASQIVYGALRVLPRLDAALGRHLHRGPEKLDPWARALLWAGAYQLLYLERVPVHATVDESVRLARRERGPKVGGFVNAVLRKIAAERPERPDANPPLEIPAWLEPMLDRSLGKARARAFRDARVLPPPIDLRVELARTTRAELRAAILGARPDAEVVDGALSSAALRVRHAGDPRALPGYAEGLFAVQEEGSQVIAQLVGAREGERIADACAGRGGKTAILATGVGSSGSITAIDVNEARLGQIRAELDRLGIQTSLAIEPIDLTIGTAGLDRSFDAVLVDAPCTGIGTIHRRPEILLRTTPADPARLAVTQAAILANAARLVRPGGRLVYAVCSPLAQEGPLAVARAGEVGLVADEEPLPAHLASAADEDGWLRLGPFLGPLGGTDAYQVKRFIVR
jgi:16S rRNA (cytosine967-C5)-methyltransferase